MERDIEVDFKSRIIKKLSLIAYKTKRLTDKKLRKNKGVFNIMNRLLILGVKDINKLII